MGSAAKTFSTKRAAREKRNGDDLGTKYLNELLVFFDGLESIVGLRSSHEAVRMRLSGLTACTAEDAHDHMLAIITRSDVGFARPVYRALQRMDVLGLRHHAFVLYRLLGPRNLSSEFDEFDELAPIAELTNAAHEARERVALHEGLRREVELEHHYSPEGIAERFWKHAADRTHAEKFIEEAKKNEDPTPSERRAIAIARARVESETEAMADLASAAEWQSATATRMLTVKLSAMEGADRQATPRDAIRSMLTFVGDKKAGSDRHASFLEARKAFIAQVMVEAHFLRQSAERAYVDVRRAIG